MLVGGCSGWRDTVTFVQPDTIVRWHRSAWCRYWTWKSRRRTRRRPRITLEVQEPDPSDGT